MKGEMRNNIFEDIANKLVIELKEVNIEAYIWHVATTGSVYIRFNDNRIGSVRLGNHDGREKLKYKFNIRNDMGLKSGKWIKDEDKWRYYIPCEKWKELIPILQKRSEEVKQWEESKFSYTIPNFKRK